MAKKNILLRLYLLRHLSHPKIPLQGSGKLQDKISFHVIPASSERSAVGAFQSGISISLSTKVIPSLSRSNSNPLYHQNVKKEDCKDPSGTEITTCRSVETNVGSSRGILGLTLTNMLNFFMHQERK